MTPEAERLASLARTADRRMLVSRVLVMLAAAVLAYLLLSYTLGASWSQAARALAAVLAVAVTYLSVNFLASGLEAAVNSAPGSPKSSAAGLASLAAGSLRKTSTAQDYANHLDAIYPQLEDSTSLLLETKDQSTLAVLQREKVAALFTDLDQSGDLARSVPAFAWRTVATAWSVAAMAFVLSEALPASDIEATLASSDTVRVARGSVKLKPPVYVGVAPSAVDTLDFSTYEDADVTWQITLNRDADSVQLMFHDGEILELDAASSRRWNSPVWNARSSVYRVIVDDKDIDNGVFRIDAQPDQSPQILVSQPANNVRMIPAGPVDTLVMPLHFEATDDYGLTQTRARITLARGNGEQVRFREEAIDVAPRWSDDRRAASVVHELDLIALGMEPGDELYVYAEALDNRAPTANVGTSDTFIVRWPGADDIATATAATLAVPVLPEFFRSQRQIIIDTERLLQQRGDLDDESFNQQAQSLAIDQKLLRLRYGQYLGEEDDSGIGAATRFSLAQESDDEHDEHDEHEEHDEHDEHDEEHDAVRKEVQEHTDHDHAGHADEPPQLKASTIGNAQAAIELNAHMHDREEQATLFEPKTRALLRSALAQMWDAELQLRLAQPDAALPFEYAALKFLKEVQQSDRVYARRTGFRPTPIDEERRLSAELDDIVSRQVDNDPRASSQNRRLRVLLNALTSNDIPSTRELGDLTGVVRSRAMSNPTWLPALGAMERLQRDRACIDCVDELTRELWRQLEESLPAPSAQPDAKHPIQRAYDQRRGVVGGSATR